jgi:hypothetical protein
MVAAAVAENPGGSIPEQMGDAHQAKAAYRLFDTPDVVTFEALAGGHWARTRRGLAGLGPPTPGRVALLVGDQTDLDYTRHPGTKGTGPIGDNRGRGMRLHTVLALDGGTYGDGGGGMGEAPEALGRVQGVAWQDVSYRQPAPEGETRAGRSKRDRESRVWAAAVAACGRPPDGARYVHVCDSGADDFGMFDACRSAGSDFLVRACQDRRAALGHEAVSPSGRGVLALARSLPALGGKVLDLRARSRVRRRVKASERGAKGVKCMTSRVADVPGRRAKLLVSAGAVTVFAPWLDRSGRPPLRLWVVRVWEVDAPPGAEPVEWVLLTSVPVATLADALRVAEWYACRWLVEEYHKCLKTGCAAEARQLEHADRLEPLLGILTVVAARLLALKQQAWADPHAPAAPHVGELEVRLVAAERGLDAPPDRITVYQFWREVAKMGGFLGRRGDGEPGWQTVWRGWRKLQAMARGARLLQGLQNPQAPPKPPPPSHGICG